MQKQISKVEQIFIKSFCLILLISEINFVICIISVFFLFLYHFSYRYHYIAFSFLSSTICNLNAIFLMTLTISLNTSICSSFPQVINWYWIGFWVINFNFVNFSRQTLYGYVISNGKEKGQLCMTFYANCWKIQIILNANFILSINYWIYFIYF